MAVKRGNVSVQVYRQKRRRGYVTFTVTHYEDGLLKRRTFRQGWSTPGATPRKPPIASTGERDSTWCWKARRAWSTRGPWRRWSPCKSCWMSPAAEYARALQLLQGRGRHSGGRARCFIQRQGGSRSYHAPFQDIVDVG